MQREYEKTAIETFNLYKDILCNKLMEPILVKFNTDYFRYFKFLENLRKKYLIGYNCDKLPDNHLDFTELDIQTEKQSPKQAWYGKDYLRLTSYREVIIELENGNFELMIAGKTYKVLGGKKYIPKFPNYHDICIKIVPNLKIYVNQSNHIDLINIMFERVDGFMYNFNFLDENNDIDSTINGLLLYDGLAGTFRNKKIIEDHNVFLEDYKNILNNFEKEYNRCTYVEQKVRLDMDTICNFFDDLIKTDTIQICENNGKINLYTLINNLFSARKS